MSLFSRVLSRAGLPGSTPLARIKGLTLSRAPEPDPEAEAEEPAQPLRRAAGPLEEAMQPLRRAAAAAPEEPEEAPAQPMRRAAAAPPETPEEEQAQPLRRAAADTPPEDQDLPRSIASAEPAEEPQAQALRRAAGAFAGPEVEDEAPLAAVRWTAPDAQTMDAQTSLPAAPQDDDPAAAPAMALRRLVPLAPPASPAMAAPEAAAADAAAAFAVPEPVEPAALAAPDIPMPPPATRTQPERPRVVIEQVDVLIHEPPAPTPGPVDAAHLTRLLRSRYLMA